MLKIWGRTSSINVQKVMWAVGELGLAHERIDAGGQFGRLDSEAYGRMNPNRRVPVLEDGEAVLWESNTIVRYLAARYGAGSLWLEDPAARARSERWMDWEIYTLIPDLRVIFWGLIRTPEVERDMPAIEAAEKSIVGSWRIVEDALANGPFIAGDRLTVGDVSLGAAVHRYLNLPIQRPSLPSIEAYYARLGERPPYREHVMLPVT